MQPHLPVWDGPDFVYCLASCRYHQLGRVMRACCPDQVDDHNPVSPIELFCPRPRLGQFVWPRWWQVSRGDTGATQDMTLGGYDCRWDRKSAGQ